MFAWRVPSILRDKNNCIQQRRVENRSECTGRITMEIVSIKVSHNCRAENDLNVFCDQILGYGCNMLSRHSSSYVIRIYNFLSTHRSSLGSHFFILYANDLPGINRPLKSVSYAYDANVVVFGYGSERSRCECWKRFNKSYKFNVADKWFIDVILQSFYKSQF